MLPFFPLKTNQTDKQIQNPLISILISQVFCMTGKKLISWMVNMSVFSLMPKQTAVQFSLDFNDFFL